MDTELIERCLRGELTPDESRALARALAADPAARAAFAREAREFAALGLAARQLTAARSARPRRRRSTAGRWPARLVAVAALAAAAVVAAVLLRGPVDLPTVDGGVLTVAGRAAGAGESLRIGDAVAAGGGGATLRWRDGTRVVLAAGARAALAAGAGKTLALDAGALDADVAPQPAGAPLVVRTPRATATVVGTRLRVAIDGAQTRLDVRHGRVRFARTRDGAAVDVAERQYAIAGDDQPLVARSSRPAAPPSPYTRWKRGPASDAASFPIGVWLQQPANAQRWRDAGVNVYVGLWEGPTDEQLAALGAARMPVICEQNAVGLAHRGEPTIVGWFTTDEPDNAQDDGHGGYGPPLAPERVVADYARVASADPERPVMVNFGQAVAWDGYYGRGVRANHPEDYAAYVRGGDIVAFDIYPACSPDDAVRGKLELVGSGTARLRALARPEQPVWAIIACSAVHGGERPTGAQLWSQAWLAVANGAQGIVWFAHEFEPAFTEHAPLDDARLFADVQRVDRALAAFAPVVNDAALAAHADPVAGADAVATIGRRHGGDAWLVCAAMGARGGDAQLRIAGCPAGLRVEDLDDGRSFATAAGGFTDRFAGYAVHRYRIVGFADAEEEP